MNEPKKPISIDLNELVLAIRSFVNERDWGQFHTPKNLVMALTGEVGELAEIFQWLTPEQAQNVMGDPLLKNQVLHELADVCTYTLRLADVLGVDLGQAILDKLNVNAQKYPVALAKGRAEKYTRFASRVDHSFSTLWLDLGNVLVFFSYEKMLKQLSDVLKVSPSMVSSRLQDDRLQWRFEKGLIDKDEFIDALISLAPKSYSLKGSAHQELQEKLVWAFTDIFSPNQPMIDWVLNEKKVGKNLMLVSNTNAFHFNFIRNRYEFINAFDSLILSFEIKAMKPENEYFVQALAQTKTNHQKILYIDDLAENISGGRKAGVNTHQFNDFERFQEFLRNL